MRYLEKRSRKRLFSWISMLVLVMGLLVHFSGSGLAYAEKTGVLTGTNVNVRTGPGTEYGKITQVNTGQQVTIIGEATATTGNLWYQVRFSLNGKNYEGYIYAQYVSITSSTVEDVPAGADGDFEKKLDTQGFPESYRKYLRALHKNHPNWVFEAVKTNLDWNTVIKNECVVGRNLVPSSSLASWKSTEPGAYNWDNGTWYGLDTASWVAASKEIIEYFMDPRNFLLDNDARILQFEALSYVPATQNKSGVANILAASFMATEDYYRIFMEAGSSSGVSPYHLSSRCLQEVGKNGSKSSSGTVPGYEGYYNFFNIGATPGGQGAVINGMIKAKSMGWTSPEKSIKGGATFVGSSYINKLQNTLYLQKFDVVDGGNGYYSHQYMTNLQAPTSEAKNMKKAYSDFNTAAITFYIPVYNNMPETACPQPTGDGNPNNLLSSLTVNGYSLTPAFSKYTQEYSLVVPNNVSAVTIGAKSVLSNAKISGAGTVALQVGNNDVKVVCTAQNGTARTYTIHIARSAAAGGNDNSGDVKVSTNYRLNNYISGIPAGTTGESLLGGVRVEPSGCTARVVTSAGGENKGVLRTGDKLQVLSGGTVKKEYPVVIYGDVNGDGSIDLLDLTICKRHVLGLATLSGAFGEAANVNRSSDGINILDLTYMKRHILGIQAISQ